MATETIQTPLMKRLGMKYPIFLAGMNVAAGPELCAAVSNAGGLGCIGGVGYTPDFLRRQIKDIKKNLARPDLPFGIDLLLPQVGGSARKTNYDYTGGQLPELIDIIIESGARLFISAVGVPPQWAVEKLHKHNILVMNMVGAPKHAKKAIEAGVDIICAQGSEGGGHTGDIGTSVLIPACVDLCKGRTSSLTGDPIAVVAAGGIYDARGLAMALSLGAQGVWVGTRFVCAKEAGAPPAHQKAILGCDYHDTIRTVIFTGRPMRVLKNDYIMEWENNRASEIKELTSQGVIPAVKGKIDMEKLSSDSPDSVKAFSTYRPWLMGQVAGSIRDVKPAKEIMEEMMQGAIQIIRQHHQNIMPIAKL